MTSRVKWFIGIQILFMGVFILATGFASFLAFGFGVSLTLIVVSEYLHEQS